MTDINNSYLSEDHYHQSRTYNNYVKSFYPSVAFKERVYKDLYCNLSENENLTRVCMGDFYFEKYLNIIKDNLKNIEKEVLDYVRIKNLEGDAVEYIMYHKPLAEKRVFELLIKDKDKIINSNINTDNDTYKKEVWFKVGVLLASGEMEKYFTENRKDMKREYSAPKIAIELGNVDYDKTILATMKGYHTSNINGNKNIYNSFDKMQKIIKHCKENEIDIIPEFLSKLPIE